MLPLLVLLLRSVVSTDYLGYIVYPLSHLVIFSMLLKNQLNHLPHDRGRAYLQFVLEKRGHSRRRAYQRGGLSFCGIEYQSVTSRNCYFQNTLILALDPEKALQNSH